MTDKEFQKVWGFSREDLIKGKKSYTLDNWFEALDKVTNTVVESKAFENDTDEEKAKFKCLVYIACSVYAAQSSTRDLADKTYPHLHSAILKLQADYEQFGALLGALQKKLISEAENMGLKKDKAVKHMNEMMRQAYERSFVPKASDEADMAIEWTPAC